ncbi:unnamed protein product [Adineta steineri]|uniref:TLC domain-containing protein n=1 Tax=Adineta steineri TaxID=433720 RepID=A0A815GHL6_9BILA|nr:unnamed protein product [Adineta steineri]CAF3694287.1 unnamed protein product [Adineta steineri]
MLLDDHVRFEYLGNTPSPDVPIYTIIFLSTVVNSLIFYLLPSKLTPSLKTYIISTIHAIICVCGVLNFFVRYSVNLKQINRTAGGGIYGTGDEIMAYSICYSLGYFIYDILLMVFCKSVRTTAALAHHIIILLAFYAGLINGICHPCHFYLLAEELSTIPLNLKALYHNRPRLYAIFGYLFVFSFLVSRLIYGSIICGYALCAGLEFFQMAFNADDLTSITFGLVQGSLGFLTRVLNIYWTVLIVREVLRPSEPKNKSL